MNVLKRLYSDEKFWLAVFGVVQSVLFYFVPAFPPEIWQSIDVLIAILIAAIAAGEVAEKAKGTHWNQQR